MRKKNTNWLTPISILSVALLPSCDSKPSPSTEPPPRPTQHAFEATSSFQSSASATPSTSSSSSASQEIPNMTGIWEGSYEAKKATVEMPPKVKDEARAKDSGTIAVGKGTVTITISADNSLKGIIKGPLGPGTLSGQVDNDMIRGTILPDDPTLANAMTGVLVGPLRNGVISARISVSGPNAVIVREALFELKRKN